MKRLFDIVVASVLLLSLAPLLAVISIAILLAMGAPVFFKQQRPGKNGKPFEMIKFRTMRAQERDDGVRQPDAERLSSFGRLLRNLSLDELPELVNVLKGDMSIVGPRPLLMEYLPLYSAEQMRRHDLRPGITGWAQVNGRNAVDWPDRFKLDVWYVDNRSMLLDLKILFMTVFKVISREGISQAGEATMQPFRGNRAQESGD